MTLEKSLPSLQYYLPEAFERERRAIFCREWFCVGREEDIPGPNGVQLVDVVGESILLVRTKEGELKAYYNVCRHRGARLCGSDEKWKVTLRGGVTAAGTLRCPYHQWTYSLDGKLLGAPFLEESAGFRKEEFSLYPVGVETWGGFIFLNLSPQAGSDNRALPAQLGRKPEKFTRYPLRDLRTAKRIFYDVASNWKIVLENFNECYHCGGVHPELCNVVPAFRQGGSNLDWERGIPHRPGAYTFTTTGTTTRQPFAGLNEDEKVLHLGEHLPPNLLLSVSCDHVAAFFVWPLGPERTRIECRFLFHPQEMQKSDFDPLDAVEFWDLVNRQDWAVCERVQQGLRLRVHEFGYYAPMEDDSLDIRHYVNERIGSLPWNA